VDEKRLTMQPQHVESLSHAQQERPLASHYHSQCRLWLAHPLTLYGGENTKLAPGYQPPVSALKNNKLRIETGTTP
jgi:hypothetical protein